MIFVRLLSNSLAPSACEAIIRSLSLWPMSRNTCKCERDYESTLAASSFTWNHIGPMGFQYMRWLRGDLAASMFLRKDRLTIYGPCWNNCYIKWKRCGGVGDRPKPMDRRYCQRRWQPATHTPWHRATLCWCQSGRVCALATTPSPNSNVYCSSLQLERLSSLLTYSSTNATFFPSVIDFDHRGPL